ncbi:MAG: OsmC family protein, partial [Sulfuritalea sp.]|nr:OsmC family protein [Sulfuritalea sp.]
RWNPEEMLVASLSSCHMLWYLHLCAQAKITVLAYHDDAQGTMVEGADGGGHFSQVTLRPVATLAAGSDEVAAKALHEQAHHLCFIANSVNFPVAIEPTVRLAI